MPQIVLDYARLINQAIVELPGASDQGIRQALFEVFHEFFTTTNSWQETITVSIVANTVAYSLVIAESGEFVRLLDLLDTNGTPQPAISDMVGNITLRDIPSAAATWSAIISKTVGSPLERDGKPQIPDWTVSRWEPVLSAGLLGRMMMQSRKPFSNQPLGRYWLQKFRNGMGEVKSAVIHGGLYGANTWSYPRGFRMQRASQRFGSGGTDQSFGVV